MRMKINSSLSKWGLIFLIALGLWTIVFSGGFQSRGAASLSDLAYRIEIKDESGAIEYRFFYDAHHFATLIDQGGTYAFRPHPGCDINGWGSTLYAQPFFPGAVLKHTIIESAAADSSGIHVSAEGMVSLGVSETYGSWSSMLDYAYDPEERIVTGTGAYTITLAGQMSEATEDLNLYKLASNYLDDVPLLSGGVGDTGDMTQADVLGNGFSFSWVPPDQPTHFPSEETDMLSIDVLGDYNNVDTAAMGYEPISPAFKPSLKVVLTSLGDSAGMRFGGFYDWAERQHFWSDNVGITPIIPSTSSKTAFYFDVQVESVALETCVYIPVVLK